MSKAEQLPRPGIQIRLAEKDGAEDISRIQIFKAGEFNHMYYGTFALTSATFAAMVENFKNRVYDCDLMIDYNHFVDEAAGWIKDIYMSEDQQELWAVIDWNKEGSRCVNEKEYRYISGDFTFNHTDNESNIEYGPVLYGAALTNRPFLKGMAPTTELNELTGGTKMTLEQLKADNAKLSDQVKAVQADKESEVKKLSDEKAVLVTEVTQLKEQVAGLEKSAADAKKESDFAVLLATGKAVPAQKAAFLAGDMIEFAKLAGAVNLTEQGNSANPAPTGEQLSEDEKFDKVMKLAEEKFAAGGFDTLGDAIAAARKEIK